MLRIDEILLKIDAINVDAINTVIAGGGPAGLLAAILVANKLSKIENAKVYVIDPDFGNYVRSGDYILFVFRELEQLLKDYKISCSIKNPSYAGHIKDVERILFDIVEQLLTHDNNKIELVDGEFSTYSSETVEVICNPEKPTHTRTLPCNLLIDCSGQKQVVLNEVNKKQGKTIFKRHVYENNPYWKQMHATITMKKDYDFSDTYLMDPLIKAERKKALKDLGWPYWSNPDGYINQFGGIMGRQYKSEKMDRDIIKYHFYSLVPEKFKDTDALEWMKAYMGAQTKGGEPSEIQLTHRPNKPKNRRKKNVDIYDHKPSYTTPFHFIDRSNSMFILHLGDVSFVNHIKLGLGLRRALLQIREFIESILFDATTILLQSGRFQNWSQKDLETRRDPIMRQFEKLAGHLWYGQFDKEDTIRQLFRNVSKYLDDQDYYFEGMKPQFVKNFNSLKMIFAWRVDSCVPDELLKKMLEDMHYACEDLRKYEHKAGPKFYEDKISEIEQMLAALSTPTPSNQKNVATPIIAPSVFRVTEEVKIEQDKKVVAATSELASTKTNKKEIVMAIKNYLAEEHPAILRPHGSIEFYKCKLADSLIKYVIEDDKEAYKEKIIALRKQGQITLECAFKLNQLMCELNQNHGLLLPELSNLIDDYYQGKNKWKTMLNTTSVVKAIEQLAEFAAKQSLNFVDQSYIDLCLKTEAKNIENDLRYNILQEFHVTRVRKL